VSQGRCQGKGRAGLAHGRPRQARPNRITGISGNPVLGVPHTPTMPVARNSLIMPLRPNPPAMPWTLVMMFKHGVAHFAESISPFCNGLMPRQVFGNRACRIRHRIVDFAATFKPSVVDHTAGNHHCHPAMYQDDTITFARVGKIKHGLNAQLVAAAMPVAIASLLHGGKRHGLRGSFLMGTVRRVARKRDISLARDRI